MSIDIEAIKARLAAATPGPWEWSVRPRRHMLIHRCSKRASLTVLETEGESEHAEYPCANDADRDFIEHAPSDITALVAEVERLREEAHELRLMVEEAVRAENANAEDAKRERAAVVAWLRRQWRSGWVLTDAIERGEHRREEEP